MQQEEENIKFIGVNELRIGGHILINDGACVIINITTSKTGKHGSAKAHITAKNIFTDKRVEVLHSTSEMVKVPIVTKSNYTLLNIFDEVEVSLLDEFMEEKNSIAKLNGDDICDKLKKLFEEGKTVTVTVVSAMGQSRIVDCGEEKV